jgi:diguanylate cyclase (GGDEF)-like protein
MRIALFESSTAMRMVTKTTAPNKDVEWREFSHFDSAAKDMLENSSLDAIITSKEFADGSLRAIIASVRESKINRETPVFLFTSDMSKPAMDEAFDLGVTDIFFKQELPALADILQKIASFPLCISGANVMLVEDDIAVSDYYMAILKTLNCTVFQASNCAHAEDILDNNAIELVITDLNLEDGGQGQRIIHKMRHNQTLIFNKIPIMVLSSIATPQVQSGLFFLGIDDFLEKPIEPMQFALRAVNLVKKFRVYQESLQQAQELKEIAHHDKLTRLYNRHGFEDIANFCIANSQRQVDSVLGILYIDLDNFKPINDQFGHEVGDKVLVEVANILKTLLRDQDIIARWGGDEFIVLLNQCDPKFIEVIANRVQARLGMPEDSLCGVSCSIGLAFGEAHSFSELNEFIKQADERMYVQKKAKKLEAKAK